MKKSLYPHGVLALTQFIAWFPSIVGQLVMMWVVSKSTVVISNVPGPKEPLNYFGVKSKSLLALIPGLGDLAMGISALSHGNTLLMAVQSDVSYLEDPDCLMDLIEKNYDQLVGNMASNL
jgi:hypothetical protein